MFTLTTGYDAEIPVQLYKTVNNVKSTFAIDVAAVVKAAIVSRDRSALIVPAVTVDLQHAGAVLATSLIVVEIPASALADKDPAEVKMEVQVFEAGKKLPWILSGEIVQGHIS